MRGFLHPSRLAFIAFSILLVYTLVGFFLLPYVIKDHVIPAMAEKLNRPILVKEVEVNPFALSLRMTGFGIRDEDQSPMIGFEELFVNFQASSIVRWAYVFDTIRLVKPFVSAKVSKQGRVNVAELVSPAKHVNEPSASSASEQPPSEIPAIEIGRFDINSGIVEFRDDSKPTPYTLDIVPIQFSLQDFHTKPGGTGNTYAFTAELGQGETLAWQGTLAFEPIRSEGTLTLSTIKLGTHWKYFWDQFNFDIAGTFNAKGRYRFDASSSPPNVQVSEAALSVSDISIREKGVAAPVITLPALDVEGINVDLRDRKVAIKTIAIANGSIRAWLNLDKSVNFQTLLTPVRTKSGAGPSTPPAGPDSSASAGEEPEDRSLTVPMSAEVTGLSVKTHDVRFPLKEPIPLIVEHRLNNTGTVRAEGKILATPFQVDMTVGLTNIALKPFQPYLESFSRIAIDSGAIGLDGQVHLAVEHPRAPLLTYRGNLVMRSLAISDRDEGLPVASWEQLLVSQIALDLDPTTVTIKEVGIAKPTVHLSIQTDGQLNLTKLFPPAEPSGASPDSEKALSPPKKSAAPVIAIRTVKLLKGVMLYQDQTVEPTVRTGLYDLTGTIKGLSSKQVAKAVVNLAGKVDKFAPLKINGTINPLSEDTFTDLAITLEEMDLTAGSPYSGKYVGYRLSQGKLSLDLKYTISQQQLEAENTVLIDQLTFGEETTSEDATSLPVPLAVALLKDRQGKIEIDLPIRGDLNDPDFKYGQVVISTLLNLLTKIIASPFALMGNLIPGGANEEDLQFVEFLPGSPSLSADEMNKLEALGKALDERPGLRLDIRGTADPMLDQAAIRSRKLKDLLLAERDRERGQEQPMQENLSLEDEQRLVRELFSKQPVSPADAAVDKSSIDEPNPLSVEEMKHQLASVIFIEEAELRTLARQRAEEVRVYLLERVKLSEEQVFLLDVDPAVSGHDTIRSQLSITAGS
jgi:hypothetical protein